MKIYWRLILFLQPYVAWVGLSVLFSTATMSAGIGLVGVSVDLISRAALLPGIAALQVAIVGVRFLSIAKGVFRYLERLTSHEVNLRLLQNFRCWIYQRIEELAPARLSKYLIGDLLARLIGDIETLDQFYIRAIAPVVTAGIVSTAMILFLSGNSIASAVWYGGLAIVGAIIIPVIFIKITTSINRSLVDYRSTLAGDLNELLSGREEILAVGQESKFLRRIAATTSIIARNEFISGIFQALSNALVLLVSLLAMLGVLLISSYYIGIGQLAPFTLAMYVVIVIAGFEVINPLPQTSQMIQTGLQSARRVFEITDTIPVIQEPDHPEIPVRNTPIEMSNVTFSYYPEYPPAVKQVSLVLSAGRKIALVGPSGSGKSTILALLLRFWEYEQGKISMGGIDYRSLSSDFIREHFSVVSSNDVIFTATLRRNLLLANPLATEFELQSAIKSAGLIDWVSSLPNGLDTWLGNQGVALSAGERQRIIICRAILKNAPFILLDEPTSNLDVRTAANLMKSIIQACPQCGLLLISHDLIGLEDMDEILVMNQGQIVERGTHSHLLGLNGWYSRLYAAQQEII